MKKKIGFIGLGQMGKWMALNILKQDFDLTVYDLDQQALTELTEQGAGAAASPAALAADTDWIFLSLPNTEIVDAVIFGKDGLVNNVTDGFRPVIKRRHRWHDDGSQLGHLHHQS